MEYMLQACSTSTHCKKEQNNNNNYGISNHTISFKNNILKLRLLAIIG